MEFVGPWLILPFFVLLVLGVPVAFCLGFSVLIFFFFSGTTIPIVIVFTEMYDGVAIGALLAFPLFILTGSCSRARRSPRSWWSSPIPSWAG